MPKINQEEYEVLKGLDSRWKWIARDDENQIYSAELYVFERKPEQEDGYWNNISNGKCALLEERDDPFQFIQWEDEEPYEIAELIREYEMKELRLAPTIPKYVAEFLELVRSDVSLMLILEVASTRRERSKWEKEYDWISENDEVFARAWLDGYEVEEEQKYFVSSRESVGFWFLSKNNDNEVVIGTNKDYYDKKWESLKLTEEEIKDYDSRYMVFAIPVEEMEE